MGQTILAGAMTSIFSGIFLCICEADSLTTFGVLLLTTVSGSMITALIVLPGLLYLIGPSGDQGKIPFDRLLLWSKSVLKGKMSNQKVTPTP